MIFFDRSWQLVDVTKYALLISCKMISLTFVRVAVMGREIARCVNSLSFLARCRFNSHLLHTPEVSPLWSTKHSLFLSKENHLNSVTFILTYIRTKLWQTSRLSVLLADGNTSTGVTCIEEVQKSFSAAALWCVAKLWLLCNSRYRK